MMADENPPPSDDETFDASSSQGAEESSLTKDQQGEETASEFQEGDDLAASWGAALEESEDADKVLSQNEIDSLLGISPSTDLSTQSGIQQLLHSELVHYERLPMLEVVFDRLVRLLSTSLRNFTNESVEISLESVTSTRFGDYLNSIALPAMINVFKARQWDDFGMLTVDSPLIYSIVDVLLGGRKGNALMRIEGRPYTTIEQKLLQRMVEVVLGDLTSSFDPICEVNFDFERMETNPAFAAIARPSNAAIVVKIRVDMEERGGKIEFLIPYSTIEPIRDVLLQTFMGEKFGRDSIWENHLENQLWSTEFTLEAMLDDVSLPLRDVLNFQVGSQILLNVAPDSKAFLKCGHKVLFSGFMGKKGNNIAIRIEDELMKSKNQEV